MYNVTQDKLEKYNLAHKSNRGRDLKDVQQKLEKMLREQRAKKRLYPAPMKEYINAIESSD